jgi:hypothetical protein
MFSGSPSRSLLPASLLTCALLAAAGCTSSTSMTAATQPAGLLSATKVIQLAAARARQATSFTTTMTMNSTGAMPMTMSGTMSEQIRPSLVLEVNFLYGMSEIITTKAVYLRMGVPSSLTGGKLWAETPVSALGSSSLGVIFSGYEQQAQEGNPLLVTQELTDATDLHKVGSARIGGVPVTEYTGRVSVALALAKLRVPASTPATGQTLASALITSAIFQIWLDGQQQVRKIVATESSRLESTTVTTMVTGINQPVTIQLPPAAEVYKMPAIVPKSAGV